MIQIIFSCQNYYNYYSLLGNYFFSFLKTMHHRESPTASRDDALPFSLRAALFAGRVRYGRGWNETWIKYNEWLDSRARSFICPSSSRRDGTVEAGDLVHHVGASPVFSLSGGEGRESISILLPPPPPLPVCATVVVILVFHVSINVILSSLIFLHGRLFHAVLHPLNSMREASQRTGSDFYSTFLLSRNVYVPYKTQSFYITLIYLTFKINRFFYYTHV